MENNNNEKEVNGNVFNNNESFKKKKFKKSSKKEFTKKDDSKEVYERRNRLLIKFFRLIDVPVRLVGNLNRPAIIYDEQVVLNAYVHNFELRFTDAPYDSNIIYTVELSENPKFDKNTVLKCLSEYKARAIYKIYLKGSEPKLYLAGYNYLNKEEKLGRYPVFSAYNAIIHFTEDGVKTKVDELNTHGYKTAYE